MKHQAKKQLLKDLKKQGWNVKSTQKSLPTLLITSEMREALIDSEDTHLYPEGKPKAAPRIEENVETLSEKEKEFLREEFDIEDLSPYGTVLSPKEIRIKPIRRPKDMRGWGLPRFHPAPQSGISATNKDVGKAPTTMMIKKRNRDSALRQVSMNPEYIHTNPKSEVGGTRNHRKSAWSAVIPKRQEAQRVSENRTKAIKAFIEYISKEEQEE